MVVDSLEKFQSGMINTNTDAGRNFVQFKRQLYKLYEVKNRSVLEHDAFSMSVDRRDLKHLYKANLDFVQALRADNFESSVNKDRNQLESMNKQNIVFSDKRYYDLRNLGRLGAAFLSVGMYPYLTPYLGSMLTNFVIAGSFTVAFSGLVNDSYHNKFKITKINYKDSGEHKGMYELTVTRPGESIKRV